MLIQIQSLQTTNQIALSIPARPRLMSFSSTTSMDYQMSLGYIYLSLSNLSLDLPLQSATLLLQVPWKTFSSSFFLCILHRRQYHEFWSRWFRESETTWSSSFCGGEEERIKKISSCLLYSSKSKAGLLALNELSRYHLQDIIDTNSWWYS